MAAKMEYCMETFSDFSDDDPHWWPTKLMTKQGDVWGLKLLFHHDLKIKHRCFKTGSTLLHVAASQGHMERAQLLLENGANLEAKDKQGNTPLKLTLHCMMFFRARSAEYLKVAGLLLKYGAKINENTLTYAKQTGKPELINIIEEHIASLLGLASQGPTLFPLKAASTSPESRTDCSPR